MKRPTTNGGVTLGPTVAANVIRLTFRQDQTLLDANAMCQTLIGPQQKQTTPIGSQQTHLIIILY